jgi:hypothetical protein
MEARRQDLLGLLIQPVQRIPRYQMLLEVRDLWSPLVSQWPVSNTWCNVLQDLRKRSPEDHPDYQNLIHAVAEV